jgi:hypothetical protein
MLVGSQLELGFSQKFNGFFGLLGNGALIPLEVCF